MDQGGPPPSPPGSDWTVVMARMLGGLEKRFNARMDTSDTGIHQRMDDVESNLGSNIREVSDDLEKLKRRVELNEKGLDQKIETALNKMTAGPSQRSFPSNSARPRPLSRPSGLAASHGPDGDGRKQELYWKARRSLRLWPINGTDLKLALSVFLTDELNMDPDICEEIDGFDVRRVRSARGRVDNEVCVVFPDIETRDSVRAAAPNLAGKKMGMRLEIPEYLRPNLRALESMSYMMKQSNPQLKRNVKFDDEVMDLVMDIRTSPDGPWRKLRPDQAMEAKKNRAAPSREQAGELDSDAIQSLLSSTASSQGGAGV